MRAEKCARVCGTRKTGLVSIYFCDCAEEKEKDRETGRQRDSETERQRDRETKRQRDREAERQRDSE
jgi:hypothetical protein